MKVNVSIIIAAYNIEKYIEKCLNSVVNQTFKNLEIIVVNDGSTDETLKEIEKFKKNDTRIKIVNQENKGLIEARKSGFKVASGEYILFIDGDDWLDTKAIETLYEIAKKDNYDIVQYGYWVAYEDNRFEKGWNININKKIAGNEFLEMLLEWRVNNSIWSKFIRAEYIYKNNVIFPENISYGEDLGLTISLAAHKPRVYITNDCLYYYYQRNTSLSKNIPSKVLEIFDVTLFVKQILINNGLIEKYNERFEFIAYIHNYYLRKDLIYLYENEFSKKIFSNWKKLNISMKNNKYYRKLYEKDTIKAKVIARICEGNYYLGKFLHKVILN